MLAAACGSSSDVRSSDAEGMAGQGNPTRTTTVPANTDPTRPRDPTNTDPNGTDTPTTNGSDAEPVIEWTECGDGLDCGTLAAPIDYLAPSAGTTTLKLVRARATDSSKRIGSLLVNPGGPGFGGSYLAFSADGIYTEGIREHFDVVAWDPRGTGESTPAVDCIDTYDKYFALDITPDTDTEQLALETAATAFASACRSSNENLLAHISTADTARDMDLIRRALDEDTISFFGFSYGSELGATWATLFPDTVRAVVLDGAVDPTASGVQGSIDQAKGFEIALNAFLADCVGSCAFAEDDEPGAALDRILLDIDANDYPTEEGRPNLTHGIAYIAIISALYSEFSWPELADALDAARRGDGSGLLALYDSYYQRRADGSYGNELEAFFAISCLDDPGPLTVEAVDEYNDDFVAAAPRIGPSFTHSYACVGWPVPGAPIVTITGAGAGPIIVIGTTNDPATPFESSKAMAETLEDGIFVKVTGNGHLGYGQSSCAQDLVDDYLIHLKAPTGDVDCN